jgi:hypothetical protein
LLKRHKVWAKIPFLKNVGAYASELGLRHCLHVNRASITKNDLIRNAELTKDRIQKLLERLSCTITMVDRFECDPLKLGAIPAITLVKIDQDNAMP